MNFPISSLMHFNEIMIKFCFSFTSLERERGHKGLTEKEIGRCFTSLGRYFITGMYFKSYFLVNVNLLSMSNSFICGKICFYGTGLFLHSSYKESFLILQAD